MRKVSVFMDVEGPQVLNDNVQENTVALAKACGLGEQVGADFYRRISTIDDIWGDFHLVPQDPAYSSGHTLKVILPFYRAMGATYQGLYDIAEQSLRVVPNIKEVLASFNRKYDVWMISTSYSFFVQAFCNKVGFDCTRAYCTFVPKFDEAPMSKEERAKLLAFMEEVARMPIIEYDGKTGEVVPGHQVYYDRITRFIWEEVYNMPVGELLRRVHPVGQAQKLEAVKGICQRFRIPKTEAFYVGDSQVVEWLRGQGLTMMFNGKGRVCRLSDIMYIGEDARAIGWVVDLFAKEGRQAALDWYKIPRGITRGETMAAVTPENIEELQEKSVAQRKRFRGVAIGELS
jgi:energy-converting hydrogenase A subunit R